MSIKSTEDLERSEEWEPIGRHKHFAELIGPIYRHRDRISHIGLVVEERHLNPQLSAHGGLLLTIADFALFSIARAALPGELRAVTVNLHADFLSGARMGEFLEADGEPVRIGRKLCVLRGLITCGDRSVLSFSGTLKRTER